MDHPDRSLDDQNICYCIPNKSPRLPIHAYGDLISSTGFLTDVAALPTDAFSLLINVIGLPIDASGL